MRTNGPEYAIHVSCIMLITVKSVGNVQSEGRQRNFNEKHS